MCWTEEERRAWWLTRYFRCMCARGEVSSSNKRKVALWILLLLPHTDHHDFPLPRLSAAGPLLLSSQPPPLLPPWLPLPLSLVTAPISHFARANSQIANFPRSSRSVWRWRQSRRGFEDCGRGKRWGSDKRGRKRRKSVKDSRNRGVNAFDRIAFAGWKDIEGRVRSKIGL